MKIGISGLILIFAILMVGCSAEQYEDAEQPSHIAVSIPAEPTEDVGLANTGQETDHSSHGMQEVDWQTYMERYGAEHCFVDALMREKCWLVCDDAIIQLISIADYDDVITVSHDSAERVQYASFDNFVSIEVFDRTNQSILIIVDTQQAEPLLALLENPLSA